MENYPKVVILIGARASGKSTVGRELARMLAVPLVDTDVRITEQAGMSIAAIVEAEGWPGFREREHRALVQTLTDADFAVDGLVVATGGGMVLDPRNRLLMREKSAVVYLKAEARCLRKRLQVAQGVSPKTSSVATEAPSRPTPDPDLSRPSLTGQDPLLELEQVLVEREALYQECAHNCVDASLSAPDLARRICELLETTKEHAMVE